jgi:hypothetical protein
MKKTITSSLIINETHIYAFLHTTYIFHIRVIHFSQLSNRINVVLRPAPLSQFHPGKHASIMTI